MGVGSTHLSLLSAVFAGTALIQAASARLQPLDVHKLTTPVGFGTYLEPELLRRWRPVFAPLEPQKGWISRLQNVTARVYSQGRQDSVLALIFDSIGVTNCFAVEFGFDSPTYEGGSGSNTLFLHRAGGFQTLLLDGEFSNASINLHAHFLYANNVAELFHRYGVPQEPDFVSCDMDSHDAFVLRAATRNYCRVQSKLGHICNAHVDNGGPDAAHGVPASGGALPPLHVRMGCVHGYAQGHRGRVWLRHRRRGRGDGSRVDSPGRA